MSMKLDMDWLVSIAGDTHILIFFFWRAKLF